MILSFDLGLKKMGACALDSTNRIIAWNILNHKTTRIPDIILVLDSWISCVRTDSDHSERVHVVLESQPRQNQKMLRLMIVMETYINVAFPSFVVYKIFSNMKWKCLDMDVPLTYRQRKLAITDVCKSKLRSYEPNDTWYDWFVLQKKCDDLSDAYIQGLVYNLYIK